MKNLGLVLLAVGVGLCGAFGARISNGMYANLSADGAVAMHATVTEAALAAYCELQSGEPLPEQEQCPAAEEEAVASTEESPDAADAAGSGDEAAEELVEEAVEQSPEDALTAAQEQLSVARSATVSLPAATAEARDAWLDAQEAHLQAQGVALERTELPAPNVRLKEWASKNGLPFGLGLLLVIAGSVMARVDQKKNASAAGSDADSGPVDFGALLAEIVQGTANLHAQMANTKSPTAEDFESVKSTIEQIKLEQIERLIDARIAVQARHGLETYAKIFGPLSGGERLLNRAWAAATDGHWPESFASVGAAKESLESARAQVPST